MKFTPGPWHVSADRFRTTVIDNAHTGVWRAVAECKTPEDAQLVAAAPVMLDALEMLQHFAEGCYKDVWRHGDHDTQHFCPVCGENDGCCDVDCPMPIVRDALNLAKGASK